MLVFESLDEIDPGVFAAGSCVAVGKFDGLHLGHQAILRQLDRAAEKDAATGERSRTVVFTFANNPLSYLNPAQCPHPLMSRAQRLAAFADAGVDVCVMVEFDEAFSQIPAESFVTDVLVGKLRARHVVMGDDFRFGHRGAGDGALLERFGAELGFRAELVEWVADNGGEQVSSSRVREALAAGDVETAHRMLGRPAVVRGEVVHGDARGRELGFPTANLGGEIEGYVPADGVYSGWVVIDGVRREAAISVGNNPTFTPDEQSRVEAFILDFDGDLYGESMEVQFTHRLRGTVAFESLVALIDQMHADVSRTRELLSGE